MIIVCQSCNARLQIDEDKSPSGAFTIRCPKCKAAIQSNGPSSSPTLEQSAVGISGSPSTEHPRYVPATARAYQLPDVVEETATPTDDVLRNLMNLLGGNVPKEVDPAARPAWNRRKALVCSSEHFRDTIAKSLSENSYQVFVADDTRQAVETMRANQMDVVLMEPQFDSAEQGSAFVVREINVLRPAQRRRLFFVLVSPSLRTMDAHAAFLNNVNAIVNINDLVDLPRILDIALREYNELYRELNAALHLTAL